MATVKNIFKQLKSTFINKVSSCSLETWLTLPIGNTSRGAPAQTVKQVTFPIVLISKLSTYF
jgi:hypothetical protein